MMDETFLMNRLKEQLCFVSADFSSDLKATASMDPTQNRIRCSYVLPTHNQREGHLVGAHNGAHSTQNSEILTMNNERIVIPELLFNPSDIGLKQAGVDELLIQSIETTPTPMHAGLFQNILVTGGSTLFDGFIDRLTKELRAQAPTTYKNINVTHSSEPCHSAWYGGQIVAQHCDFIKSECVTREQYMEHGQWRFASYAFETS
eukprot:CAMPEP_0201560090 /NCGR_PEP_ID=MMETSP0173_2-20130828/78087_1 /ASSEMBLY_ACC=CAM_ASM_000268 /TAXON_ID=218659 /ORGANISM="Vexillifera sp., Strain DIVA3 564/2" /LENGTH=203 /DNA_ID=CAMNT_0047974519 /DNA_START=593 /DNA_END=1204 /DNA_ORIENTATION=-